jgi:alpha-D-xyloside xylohydrolase
MLRNRTPFSCVAILFVPACLLSAASANQPPAMLSDPVDVSGDFHDFANTYFLADSLSGFDPATGAGTLNWQRNHLYPRIAFDTMEGVLQPFGGVTFPEVEYAVNPALPFSIQFVSPRTVRIRVRTGPEARPAAEELMLVGEPPTDRSWQMTKIEGGYRYTSSAGSVIVYEKPWHIEFRDAQGRLLTRTNHESDNGRTQVPVLPFSFIRRPSDYSRSLAAVFSLSAGEKLFGCGESFTGLNKRGQKVVLYTNDAQGPESTRMYKPVPFFLSDRGYGMFVHTSAPATFDFGAAYQGTNTLMLGDDELDLFVFLGEPKDVLNEYTNLTGKAAMPPLWSFGLWMSRISYFSEDEVRGVAAKLREERLPADVIHIDTGWFEHDWRCDYQFSTTRFKDPARMIADLKQQGLHISLWQLPYFVPQNRLFPEIVEKGLYVKDGKGNLPFEDAVLDFSNPATVKWYQDHLAGLLKMGVGAIKVDFGESAPLTGVYASGRTGFYEHNLYPLRYNKAVADITRQVSGENIIWARSAWAGSQRYPLHWGGDAATTDIGMAATLRGGLSLGLSGFSFWSHDIGGFAGFPGPTPELYRRWLPFGMLTSHSRCHGAPPKEPWLLGAAFTDDFRRADELKYRLMPYVYAQAKDSSERGLPMVRALFVEFPGDPGAWTVEDEYLFGSQILVAPLMEAGATGRDVYLPAGQWIDYQTGRAYAGGWHRIEAGKVPVVMLVRDGAVIPHIALAQSTMQMDWSKLDLVVFASGAEKAEGLVCLPSDGALRKVSLAGTSGAFAAAGDVLAGKAATTVKLYSAAGIPGLGDSR